MVALNIISKRGYRIEAACEAVPISSSVTYVVQGGPSLVRINCPMEIFNCTNHKMTIEKDSLLGITEKLSTENEVEELNVT